MLFTVAGSTTSLKVMATCAVLLTPVAPFTGVTDKAVNEPAATGVALVPVVNVLVKAVVAFPWMSAKPPTKTLYVVDVERLAEGIHVKVTWSLESVTVPATGVVLPFGVTVIALLPTVLGLR